MYKLNERKLRVVGGIELEESLDRFAVGEQDENDLHVLVQYVIQQYLLKNKMDFTSNEVYDRITTLVAGHILRVLVEMDFLDVSIDEQGKAHYTVKESNGQDNFI